MEVVCNSEGIPIGIILNPGEQCNCKTINEEIPDNIRTWCNDCILIKK